MIRARLLALLAAMSAAPAMTLVSGPASGPAAAVAGYHVSANAVAQSRHADLAAATGARRKFVQMLQEYDTALTPLTELYPSQ